MSFSHVLVLIPLLLGVGVAVYAQDPEAVRAAMKEKFNQDNFTEKWMHRNGALINEKPEIKTWNDEQLIFARTKNGVRKDYHFNITHVALFESEVAAKLKSTTCPNVPSTLKCKIGLRFPQIRYSLRPVGSPTGPEGRESSLDIDSAGRQFAERHFPEVRRLMDFGLTCDRWDWIRPGSKSIEVMEAGSVVDTTITDLNINAKDQFHALGGLNCPDDKGRCGFSEKFDGRSIELLVFFSDNFTWFMEVQDGTDACTVEFQSAPVSNLAEQFEDAMKRPYAPLSTPEMLKKIRQAISPKMIDDWVRTRISAETRTGFFDRIDASELYAVLNYPLMSFLEIASPRSSSTGGGKFSVDMADQFEEDEGN